jgi:two-component system cell cycle response regulator
VSEAARRKIVVIEDNEDVRDLLRSLLESAGHDVVSTTESKTAAELVKREAPDLVLCDIAMPELDGYGVLKALKADAATAGYPFVFLTAHREFTERVKAFKAGAVDYVTKPFTRDTLLRKVERIFRGLGRGAESGGVEAPGPPPRDAPGRDPETLPDAPGSLPPFGSLPEALRTVLIADDNRAFRTFLGDLLVRHGFTVFIAADGEEALAVALEKRPWLILADVNMPVVDGFELIRRVRATSLIGHTPFVFLSGWDDYRDRQRGLQLGADEFLSKQTPVRELLIRVHLLLQRYSDGAAQNARKPVMEGSIEVVGAAGVLQMWHQSRLSGVCTVRAGSQLFEARFRDGEIVYAGMGERVGAQAVYEFLNWMRGHFRFVPGDVVDGGEPIGESFDQLLLEGCRLLDESRGVDPGAEGAAGA